MISTKNLPKSSMRKIAENTEKNTEKTVENEVKLFH